MKKITFLVCLAISLNLSAQTDINFDANASWLGYMSWTGPSGNGEGGWGVPDLVTIIDTGSNTATLKPNRVNDLNSYWQTVPAGLLGEKIMTATTLVEDSGLVATNFDWTGEVSSFTLDNSYSVSAFIKIFAAGYSLISEQYQPITGIGTFSMNYDGTAVGAAIVQYGFVVIGPNVNPEPQYDADYDNFGSVVITAATLGVNENRIQDNIKAYPNPSVSFWTIDNQSQSIQTVELFDVTGKRVLTQKVLGQEEIIINSKNLPKGLYIGRIETITGVKTIKLVRE